VRWIQHQISVIKAFYRYLAKNHLRLDLPVKYSTDISQSIENEHIDNSISKVILTTSQAKKLILCTKNKRKYIWHYRDYAMLYLMITTGLRSVEIRRAKKKDLRFLNGQTVLYIQGKGKVSKDEFVKVTSGVNEAIDAYLAKRKDKNPYLFISHSMHTGIPYLSRSFFYRTFKRILKECEMESCHITPHSLRHTAATLNLLRGGSLENTRRLLRHKDLSTTLIYASHIEKMEDNSANELEAFILGEATYIYDRKIIMLEF
jgi:site-specific recombinase XerD